MSFRSPRRTLPALAAVLSLGLGLSACGSSDSDDSSSAAKPVFTMVTDQAGLGDQGFNDLAKIGIDEAAGKTGGEAKVIQSSEQAQYVPNLQQAAAGSTLTIGVGFLLTDPVAEVASANPDAKFVLIDATALGADEKPLPNVASVNFKEQEAAFLAGIIAGKTTKTKRIGFVGGMESAPVERFLAGFKAGVKQVDPSIRIDTAYLGNFTDSAKAKELTKGFADAGADIVMEVAGSGGLGVYDAAKEEGDGFWAVGTDTCKDKLAPNNYLTSATKDVAGVVSAQSQAAAKGGFKGGELRLGLAEDAVGVCEDTFGDLPQDVQDLVGKAREAIKSGSVTVPDTEDGVAGFTPAEF